MDSIYFKWVSRLVICDRNWLSVTGPTLKLVICCDRDWLSVTEHFRIGYMVSVTEHRIMPALSRSESTDSVEEKNTLGLQAVLPG